MKKSPRYPRFRSLLPCLLLAIPSGGLAAPGDADASFGTAGAGAVTVAFTTGNDLAYGMTVQPDNRILLAGSTSAGDFALCRLQANGSLDAGFGTAGKVVHSFGQFELARGVAVRPDGRILAGGSGLIAGGSRDFAVIRCLPNGSLDPQFGTGGIATTDIQGGFNDTAYCMAVQTDGKIIVAGSHRSGVAMARYTANGALDAAGFGTGGKVFSSVVNGEEEQANAIVVQPDGRIVVAGEFRAVAGSAFLLSRYLADGSPDPSFGTGGKSVIPISAGTDRDIANGLYLLADGKFLVAGTAAQDFALVRCTAQGQLDPGFGTGGIVLIDFGGTTDAGTGVAVQTDGKVLLAGTTRISGREYFALIRLTATGDVDTAFGPYGGAALTALTAGNDTARSIAIQSDGKILLGGDAGLLNNKDFGVARYESGVRGLTALESWRRTYFGVTTGTGSAADDADPEKDGVTNITEFGFGLNPAVPDGNLLPQPQFAGGACSLTFAEPWGISGVSYMVEWSSTLAAGSWLPIPNTAVGPAHSHAVSLAGKHRFFHRVRVTNP